MEGFIAGVRRGLVALICLAAVWMGGRPACAARLELVGDSLPAVTDGARQRSIEIIGLLDGRGFRDLRLHARWVDTGVTVTSPELALDVNNFRHAFAVGGTGTCGLVTFHASGKISGVTVESSERHTFVDCTPPRVLIGRPADGQVVRAGGTVEAEMRLEDDILSATGYQDGLKGYTLAVDVDGKPVAGPAFYPNSPVVQKMVVRVPGPGRHGIRVRFGDVTGKFDEKTVWVDADGQSPNVRILSPSAGSPVALSGAMPAMRVEVEASDGGGTASGIDRVEFYQDGTGVAVARTPDGQGRYVGTFGARPGQQRLSVKAFDKAGNASESSVVVEVVTAGAARPAGTVPAIPRTLPGRGR